MKKNISINLFGTLYNIDEDAYNLLERYLQSMQRYFSRQEGGEEIADDIEHRVAELLWKRHEAGMTAIDISVVKEIIDTIGNPEQIAGYNRNDGSSSGNKSYGTYNKQEKSFSENLNQFADEASRFARETYDKGNNYIKTHRFYRCEDDKVLGGVCSGLAAYFNTGEPLLWRLGAIVLMLIGVGIPLIVIYIVIWLATPAALTPEDRLRQQGKAITPDNLAQQVMEESQPIVVKDSHKGCLKAVFIVIGIFCVLLLIGYFWMILKALSGIFF